MTNPIRPRAQILWGRKNELEKGLKDLDQERISTYLSSKQCDFLMNVPEAIHMGGVWERQIRTIRSVMNVVMAQVKGRLDDASLRTFFLRGNVNCQ